MDDTTIAIIGGTGPQGRGLAMRLALAGLPVHIGSRQAHRGRGIAAQLNETLTAHAGAEAFVPVHGGDNAGVTARGDLVFLTVPYESAEPTLLGIREHIRPGAAFVDVSVPLDFGKGGVQVVVPPEGSGSRHLRTLLPEAVPFCGACKTLPAHTLEDLSVALDCHTFVFGDDKAAKGRVMEALGRVPHLWPLDVGGLSAAATLEGMTALLIRINRRTRSRHGRYRVVGVEA